MSITGIKKSDHGFTDYSYVPLVFAAPAIAGFENNKPAARICRLFAASVLAYSLFTKAKWGLFKILPYKIHARLDAATGIVALGVSTLPGIYSDKRARTTFILMGITGLLVGALSLIGEKQSNKHTL